MRWAPARSPADVVADPQLAATDGLVDLEGGARRSVNGPVTFSDVASARGVRVPGLAEHTDEVLAEVAELTERDGGAGDTAGVGAA